MGRKIPVRKHRGVKDPLIQLARRNACSSIDAPPSKPNEQEMPKSVLEIQRLCALVESREKERKGKKKHAFSRHNPIDSLYLYDKDPKLPGMRRRNRDVPRILQGSDEPDEAFVLRFSEAAREFISEVELENKHDAKFEDLNSKYKENEKSGPPENSGEKSNKDESTSGKSNDSVKKKRTDDIFSDFNLNNKRGRNRRNNPIDKGTKPNKRQRRKLRLAQIKKEEHYEDELDSPEEEIDFTSFKDEVNFGEVVHRPPQFTVKPRGSELSSKPGTKDLLLKQMMNGPKAKESKKSNTSKLSNAQKHFLEKERIRVVQAYRDLKASKMKKL